MKRSGHGGRVFYDALAIGTLGAWDIKLTPIGWMLDAEAKIARYWCDAKPKQVRVELVTLVPATTKRSTEDPPMHETRTTHYGTVTRIRPTDLMLKDFDDKPPEPVRDHNEPGRADDHA